jgi:cysteine desulfurase / selenocysteine lyase
MTPLAALARNFLGLDRFDPVVEGGTRHARRVYLDSAATTLMPHAVWSGLETYLQAAPANSHTEAHRAGRDTTQAIEDSRDAIGRLVGYRPDEDVVLFTGSGATGAINALARVLFPPELRAAIKRFPGGAPESFVGALRGTLSDGDRKALDEMIERPLVVTTAMEHHSNLLPWIEAVGRHNLRVVEVDAATGSLCVEHLMRILQAEGDRVRLVTVTGVSNVTGMVNPVQEIARLAHLAGAEVMIDGAQWVPHGDVRMHPEQPAARIDYLVLSGHKMYAPGSRGALIGKRSSIACRPCASDVGGGMVDYVSIDDFSLKTDVATREEAGTPNIPGAIAMGLAAELMMDVSMTTIGAAEAKLTRYLVDRLQTIGGVVVYGSTDLERAPRAGVVAFNVEGLSHGLVATYLDDFHNIAVRDGCFCAQPYVARLLQLDPATVSAQRDEIARGHRGTLPGMVRASLGVYSTERDVDTLLAALRRLLVSRDAVRSRYRAHDDGRQVMIGSEPLPRAFKLQHCARSHGASSRRASSHPRRPAPESPLLRSR